MYLIPQGHLLKDSVAFFYELSFNRNRHFHYMEVAVVATVRVLANTDKDSPC